MDTIVCKNKEEAIEKVCAILFTEIRTNPDSVLVLASGKTMDPIYDAFVKKHRNSVDFSKLKIFMMDEFFDESEISLEDSVFSGFIKPLGIKTEQVKFIRNFKKNPEKYEDEIIKAGGIDFILLGIGENGHIAFNEPGSSIKSITRVVEISNMSVKIMEKKYGKRVPKSAITIGLATILSAKMIVLVAFGKSKAKAISLSVKSGISKKIPASFLQKHKSVKIIADRDAASLL